MRLRSEGAGVPLPKDLRSTPLRLRSEGAGVPLPIGLRSIPVRRVQASLPPQGLVDPCASQFEILVFFAPLSRVMGARLVRSSCGSARMVHETLPPLKTVRAPQTLMTSDQQACIRIRQEAHPQRPPSASCVLQRSGGFHASTGEGTHQVLTPQRASEKRCVAWRLEGRVGTVWVPLGWYKDIKSGKPREHELPCQGVHKTT